MKMPYVVQFTVAKKSAQRKHGKTTHLRQGRNTRSNWIVGYAMAIASEDGESTLIAQEYATHFPTLDEARTALCEWIMQGAFSGQMWVKNPLIVQVDDPQLPDHYKRVDVYRDYIIARGENGNYSAFNPYGLKYVLGNRSTVTDVC